MSKRIILVLIFVNFSWLVGCQDRDREMELAAQKAELVKLAQQLGEISREMTELSAGTAKLLEKNKKLRMELAGANDRLVQADKRLDSIYRSASRMLGLADKDISPELQPEEYYRRAWRISYLEEVTGGTEKILFDTRTVSKLEPEDPGTVFKVKDRKILAFYSSAGSLKGEKRVLVRWMNMADRSSVYLGVEQFKTGFTDHYVWVKNKKNWTQGAYRVELFRVDTLEKVAEGVYKVN